MSTFAYPPTAVVPESNWTQNQGGSAMNQYSFQFDTLPTYMTAGSHLESPQFYENRRYGCAFCHSMASSSWTVTDQGYLICSSCLSCSNWIPASSPPSSSPASYSPPTHPLPTSFSPSRATPIISDLPSPTPPKKSPSSSQNGRRCVNCKTSETPLWRRNIRGLVHCNACSQFERKNGYPRPESLYQKKVLKRRRFKPSPSPKHGFVPY